MSSLSTLPKGDSAWLLRKAIERIIQQISVLETNIGSSTTGNSANTQIIFNDNGVLRGDAGLTYNSTTDLLTVASATITGDLTVDTSTLKVDSSNNRVGIGTASPAAGATLQCVGTSTVSGGTGASTANGLHTWFDTGTNTGYISSFHSGVDNRDLRYDAKSHVWSLAAGTAMTLNSTGLGVGATPTSRLTIGSGSYSTASANTTAMYTAATGLEVLSDSYYFGNRTGGNLVTITSGGNVGIGVTPSATDSTYYQALEITRVGQGLTGAKNALTSSPNSWLSNNSYATYSAGIVWKYAVSQPAAQYRLMDASHQWYTAPSGTAGNAITFTQAMTLDASGNLLVGKTAGYGSSEANTIQLKSFLVFGPDNTGSASNRNWINGANGSAAGNLDWTVSSANNNWPNFAYRMQLTSAGATYNTTGTWGTISDARLKENISDARNYLNDLLKLRVVKYSLKEESSAVATKLGFIAQEVEQVFPNLVEKSDKEYEGGEGIRTVKTTVLIPMLLKAIQELTARVEALEA